MRSTSIIAEIKYVSPAEGKLGRYDEPDKIAKMYEEGGAAAVSLITEPTHFAGNIRYLPIVKSKVTIPVMMKDIIIDKVQIDAASRLGADAVLLISRIFKNRLANYDLEEMIEYAHILGIEVLLEVHDEEEYLEAGKTKADIVGINNRDLSTLQVSIETTERLLKLGKPKQPVVSESGFNSRSKIEMLASIGVDAFLIGSALMKSRDPVATLRKLSGG
jgi:indole-3-glycerol phosphate synthase